MSFSLSIIIFRFVQAGSEVSALLGRMPSAVGVPAHSGYRDGATYRSELPLPRVVRSPRSRPIYVPADDLTDPAPATTFAHLDGTIVLSRQLVELGIYPAVDPSILLHGFSIPRFVGGRTLRGRPGVSSVFYSVTKSSRTLLPF